MPNQETLLNVVLTCLRRVACLQVMVSSTPTSLASLAHHHAPPTLLAHCHFEKEETLTVALAALYLSLALPTMLHQ